MLVRRTQWILLFVLAIPSFYFGQTSRADLSGNWRLNLEKSKLPKSRKTVCEKLTIKQDGPSIEFSYSVDGKQSIETYATDKKDKVLHEIPQAGSQIIAKAYWKGSALVTETRTDFTASSPLRGYTIMWSRDSWTLSGDGLVLADKFSSDETAGLKVYDKLK